MLATATLLTPVPALVTATAPPKKRPLDDIVPGWLDLTQLALGVLGCVLLIMYLLRQVKCEKFVNTMIIGNILVCAMFFGWFYVSGTYKRADEYEF